MPRRGTTRPKTVCSWRLASVHHRPVGGETVPPVATDAVRSIDLGTGRTEHHDPKVVDCGPHIARIQGVNDPQMRSYHPPADSSRFFLDSEGMALRDEMDLSSRGMRSPPLIQQLRSMNHYFRFRQVKAEGCPVFLGRDHLVGDQKEGCHQQVIPW